MSKKYSSDKLRDPSVCRIFFSSPFNGMEGEREELTRKYWPQIDSLCRSKGIQFVPVDMRWGITMEQSASAQTINICLREIDRSDMFVGFFGQRYGWQGRNDAALQESFDAALSRYPWLEDVRDKSVTELEFLNGHLRQPGHLPTIICFRDKAFDDKHREIAETKGDKRGIYKFSSESELATTLMTDLKARVKATEDNCLAVHMAYPTPEQGALVMFDAIMDHLKNVLLKNPQETITYADEMLNNNDAVCNTRTAFYVGGEGCMSKLNHYMSDRSATGAMLVLGETGSGKTSLLANWMRNLQKQQSDTLLIYHFVKPGTIQKDVTWMVTYICIQLLKAIRSKQDKEKWSGKEEDKEFGRILGMKAYERLQTFQQTMKEAAQLTSPVIIIDGLDKIDYEKKTIHPLYWLPEELASGMKLIVSTRNGDTASVQELHEKRGYQLLEILPLLLEEQRQISNESLMVRGKTLSDEQTQRVVEAEQTHNPLFLKIVLEELCAFGKFRELDKKIDALVKCQSSVELFGKYLERLEQDYNAADYNGNLVEKVMCSIYASRYGLKESELTSLLDIPSHLWPPLYFGLEMYLEDRAGQIRFAHSELSEAVYLRYIQSQDKLAELRNDQADKIVEWAAKEDSSQSLMAHYLDNYGWLYRHANNVTKLKEVILNIQHYHLFARSNEVLYELLEYVQHVGLSGEVIAEEMIARIAASMPYTYQQEQDYLLQPNPGLQAIKDLEAVFTFLKLAHYRSGQLMVLQKMKQLVEENSWQGGTEDKRVDYINFVNFELASIYVDKMEEAKALPYFQQLIQYYEQKTDDESIHDLARMHHGAGTVYMGLRELEKAQEMFELSISSHSRVPHMDPASYKANQSRFMVARIHYLQGQYEQARDEVLHLIKKEEEMFYGELRPEVSHILTDLALIYRKLKEFDKAKEVCERTLDIKRKAFGDVHYDIAVAYVGFSNLYREMEDQDQAIMYSKKAVDVYEAIGEGQSIDAYRAKENLAALLLKQGKEEEVEELYWDIFDYYTKNNLLDTGLPYLHLQMAIYYKFTRTDPAKCERICTTCIGTKMADMNHYLLLSDLDKDNPPATPRPCEQTIHGAYKLYPDHPVVERVRFSALILEHDIEELDSMLLAWYDKSSNSQDETQIISCVNYMKETGWSDGIIELCERWRDRRKDFIDIVWQLCVQYHGKQQFDKASECGYQVYKVDRGNMGVAVNTMVMAVQGAQWDIAQDIMTDMLRDHADDETAMLKVEQAKAIMEEAGHPYKPSQA